MNRLAFLSVVCIAKTMERKRKGICRNQGGCPAVGNRLVSGDASNFLNFPPNDRVTTTVDQVLETLPVSSPVVLETSRANLW